MSRARDLANLADEATVLATDSEVSAAVAAIDLTNVQRIVPVDSNISVPGAPTSVSATVANAQSSVSFVAPTDNGGSTILSYTVISSPGNIKKSGSSSPITITGLTNGTAYTFTVKAHNIAGSSVASSASASVTPSSGFDVDYLVVAGGGGGGAQVGGGGGAGGYRTSIGGTALIIQPSTNYTVTVGGGGTAGTPTSPGSRGGTGSNSVFSTITSSGGGGGGTFGGDGVNISAGLNGGSGGGATYAQSQGTAGAGNAGGYSPVEGYAGGVILGASSGAAGGGGGSSAVGNNTSGSTGGAGGAGTSNSISGSSVTYAGGGGGASNTATAAAGGSGGGGSGGGDTSVAATAGTVNTGGGGGGQRDANNSNGTTGGSGIVIIKYPDTKTITIGAGLTGSTATSGSFKVTTFTAGTGNVSLA
jgi:hypothetical protein